jgi:uncharacterized metal-binding protein
MVMSRKLSLVFPVSGFENVGKRIPPNRIRIKKKGRGNLLFLVTFRFIRP